MNKLTKKLIIPVFIGLTLFVSNPVFATLGEYLGSGSGITKGLWHLNGSSADSSGNGNNGTDTNITYSQANGKFGQGAGFNGSSSKIILGSVAGIAQDYTVPFTISMWVKLGSTASPMSLVERYQGASPSGYFSFMLRTNATNAGDLWFYIDSSQVAADDILTAGSILNTTERKNVIITYDTSYIKLYVNGVLIGNKARTITPTSNSVKNLSLGYNGESNNYFLNGSIDEVIAENRAWSASEIKKYYTMTKGRFGIQ